MTTADSVEANLRELCALVDTLTPAQRQQFFEALAKLTAEFEFERLIERMRNA